MKMCEDDVGVGVKSRAGGAGGEVDGGEENVDGDQHPPPIR